MCDALKAALAFTCQTGPPLHLWKISLVICFQHTKYDSTRTPIHTFARIMGKYHHRCLIWLNHIRQARTKQFKSGEGKKLISWRVKGIYTSLVTFYVYTSSFVLHRISYTQGGGGKMKEGELDTTLQFLLFNSHADKQMTKFLFRGREGDFLTYCSTKTSVLN
jgi:hypothetical protein